MCLSSELSKKAAQTIKDEARKRGYIRAYKVCRKKTTGWCFGLRWAKGLRKAKCLKMYEAGWYAHLDLDGAERSRKRKRSYGKHFIKTCYAKPSWIKRLGRDDYNDKVGIFTHLAFPVWKKGDMTIREFREMCRKQK